MQGRQFVQETFICHAGHLCMV